MQRVWLTMKNVLKTLIRLITLVNRFGELMERPRLMEVMNSVMTYARRMRWC